MLEKIIAPSQQPQTAQIVMDPIAFREIDSMGFTPMIEAIRGRVSNPPLRRMALLRIVGEGLIPSRPD